MVIRHSSCFLQRMDDSTPLMFHRTAHLPRQQRPRGQVLHPERPLTGGPSRIVRDYHCQFFFSLIQFMFRGVNYIP